MANNAITERDKDFAKWYQDIDWQARMSNHKRLQEIKNR